MNWSYTVKTQEISGNLKVGKVSTTSASQVTCPISCPFYHNGCYSESGRTQFTTKIVNTYAEAMGVKERGHSLAGYVSKAEAEAILGLSGKRPLRLHVVGDCPTDVSARIVSKASEVYRNRFNQPVWTYTHAWRDVKRSSWGNVSVLASCETVNDLKLARRKKYALSMVVAEHPKDGKPYKQDGFFMIPCREQVGKAEDCTKCQLCWKEEILYRTKSVILFEAHSSTRKIKHQLKMLNS